jgi:hypothetical protein
VVLANFMPRAKKSQREEKGEENESPEFFGAERAVVSH